VLGQQEGYPAGTLSSFSALVLGQQEGYPACKSSAITIPRSLLWGRDWPVTLPGVIPENGSVKQELSVRVCMKLIRVLTATVTQIIS